MATGCYKNTYLAASYKGVTFEALDLSTEFGRRNATGEFVFGENTGLVDLGRKARRYMVNARFPKNSHIADAKALVRACESTGPGQLVHPIYGSVRVACESIKVSDNPLDKIGYTTADMVFVEATSVAAGFLLTSSLFGLDISGLLNAVQANFLANYTPKLARLYTTGLLPATVADHLTQLRLEFQKTLVVSQSNGAGATSDQYQSLSDAEDAINNTPLLTGAFTAHAALTTAFTLLSDSTIADVKYQAMRRIVNSAAKTSSLSGVAGVSQDSVYATVRLMGAARMAQAALETSVTTLNAALEQYDQVIAVLDDEANVALVACNDTLFLELKNFTSTVKTQLLNRAYKLPALVSYDFHKSVHSLVAAWEMFADARRFSEIETRNPAGLPFLTGPTVIGAAV